MRHRQKKVFTVIGSAGGFSGSSGSNATNPSPHDNRKCVVLHSVMGIGDACLNTIVLESLAAQYNHRFRIDVVGKYVNEIFRNSPHIDRAFDHQFAHHIDLNHVSEMREHRALVTHWDSCCQYVGEQLGVTLRPAFNRPIFHLLPTDQGKRLMDEPYCFVNAGHKQDLEVKWYPRWQQVIDQLSILYPRLKIVQVGARRDAHGAEDHTHPLLRGANVIDMRGRWDGNAWEFICAANQAEFGLGPTSFIKHVFAGLGRAFVCVVTGDEPLSWTADPQTKFVSRHGTLPCCRFTGCGLRQWSACTNMRGPRLPACMDIAPEDVVAKVREYVDGGVITQQLSPGPSIVVGTLYDAKMAEIGGWTSASKRAYAARHNYGFIAQTQVDRSRPASWWKIRMIADHFAAHPDTKWFWWTDADARITNLDITLESLIDDAGDCDFIIGDDHAGDSDGGFELVNSGVFLIRNCPVSLTFLHTVWDRYGTPMPHGNWEQGHVRKLLRKIPGFRVRVIPRNRFNSFARDWRPGDFVIHYTNPRGREIMAEHMRVDHAT